jgi:hypothetical protein
MEFSNLDFLQILVSLPDRQGLVLSALTLHTSLVALTSAIQVEQRRFTGSIEFHPNGTAYMSMPPGSPKYFGQPGPEIDAAWHALVGGYHFYATDAEQGTLDDADFDGSKKSWYKDDIGYYQDGTAMFHTLHCVNMIRMYIDYDYYKPTFAKIAALDLRLHSEHCLDYIRQSIMCAGDLTPVPSRWHEAGAHSRAYSDSGLLHTCRAFEPIRKLVTERHNGSSAVYVKENDDI